MKNLYCIALLMVFTTPSFSQKIELKQDSSINKVYEVVFRDSANNLLGTLNIAQHNPYKSPTDNILNIDKAGNKTFLATKDDFFSLFPARIRVKYDDSINYEDISTVSLRTYAEAFKTDNSYLVLSYVLFSESLDEHEVIAEKGQIYIYDSVMNKVFDSEVIPTMNEYAAVSKYGKYLAIQNGTVDEHITLFDPGIQILDIKRNILVYNLKAEISGPIYYEECGMVRFDMMLPVGYRYFFLNDVSDVLIYFDMTNKNERLLEITQDGLIISNSSKNTYEVKFKDMQIINLR